VSTHDRGGRLNRLAHLFGVGVRAAGAAVRDVFDRDPYEIVGYRSYATNERALILGRALEDEGLAPADAASPRWRNLVYALKRFEADPLPHARVRAHLAGTTHETRADDEGFVHDWMPLEAPLSRTGWHDMDLELPAPPRGGSSRASVPVLVPPATSRFGVISDMDDTVLQSRVTHFLSAARMMLLENARTRLPFPGVAAFYRALHDSSGTGNPVFYVSSSPWNLYDVIADFLDAQDIPPGPLLLRDWDLGRSLLSGRSHKHARIREIFTAFPRMPFILVGDSGQEDPEIYSRLVHDFPERVLAIYIRNVSRTPERAMAIGELAKTVQKAGSTLVLADDTLTVARHAAEHGWIDERMLPEIGAEKRDDEGATARKVDAPGVEPRSAPTVVVDERISASDLTSGD